MTKILKGKACNTCGKDQEQIPENARPQMTLDETKIDGYFWECDCGSTMFVWLKKEVS